MAADYSNGLMKDYQRIMLAFEESLIENKKIRAEIKELKNEITYGSLNLSKGTLVNWTNKFATDLNPLISEIREELLNS